MATPFTPAEIASLGLTEEEYAEICRRLRRHPNKAELGMFGVMWSEHCCYKNSKPLLSQFPTRGERILMGPGENAGVVDLGDGLHLAFKIESHNHPSAVEPFQGAATGVGGILRDIFTMGARPIAILNSLRFGSLTDPKTRRLFAGVVKGISHYGNCLVGTETLVWRDQDGIHFDTIGEFVESRLPANLGYCDVDPNKKVEVLSWDPTTTDATWQPLRRLFRRTSTELLQIKTALGRQITVTPDHPSLVWAEGQWQTKPAQTLQVGDMLPILRVLPQETQQPEPLQIDFLDILAQDLSSQKATYVSLPETWQVTDEVRQALLTTVSSAQSRHRYLHKTYLPLAHFLELEPLLQVQRADLKLYRRSGKANYMKAVVNVDHRFARLLGYYLSEGCVSENGNTYKIVLTFALHEDEYVEDVAAAFKDLGLKPCIERLPSTIAVSVTSWLLGYLLKDVWHCGTLAFEKALPDIFFQFPSDIRYETLKGLLRGDGSFSAKVTFATTSHKLFEQTLMLLQERGIVPSIHVRPPYTREIEGRTVNCHKLWLLEIQNIRALTAPTPIPSREGRKRRVGQERNAELAAALGQYQTGCRHSFPRYTDLDKVALVKITDIQSVTVEPQMVYDIEVANTHLFITTSGLITHNCVGVPNVGGEVYFGPAYTGNPIVNAMAIGLIETPEIVTSGASGVGNPVLYVGSTTGRDGMGGASFASAELTEQSQDQRPAVQVGDPFLEKCLIEACLLAFQTGAVVAAQDMGAAGITCSTAEMAAKEGLGIELDLDKVPVRETGMVPYEYLLSESQERMLFVAQKGREQELIDIFHRWQLHAVVAGTVIAEPIVRIKSQGKVAAEVPAAALADNTPIYERKVLTEPPSYAKEAWEWTANSLPAPTDWNDILLQLLATPTIASKRWVYRQYDHQVQNNTVVLPGDGDAAVIRVKGYRGVAATTDCNSRYVYLDPYEGAMSAVAEAARNLSCVGAEPLAVTDNLNFGSPENPVGYWQLASACRGIAQACRELKTPVTGGNVSLYNETVDSAGNQIAIYPTPVIGMIGLVEDVRKVCPTGWQTPGDIIYLLGSNTPTLGGSEYLATIHGIVAGKPPCVDFDLERAVQKATRVGIKRGWINSAHDCSEGGITVTLAECCLPNNLGTEIHLNQAQTQQRLDELLFGEAASRILVSVSLHVGATWENYLTENLGEHWQKLGFVSNKGENMRILIESVPVIDVKIEEMGDRFLKAIEKLMS